jgi:hypothetical protein
MEKYWKNKDIRESYLIAVIGFDYSDLEVEEQKEIKDDDGKVHMEAVKVKTPFSWDRVEAYIRFWKHIYNLQLREFKVNPNRIIVDGVGFGREGVMEFASGSAWRLAGVIDRGLESDKPVVQNLQYMKVLYLPSAASEKPSDKMKEMLGGALTEGTVDAAWSASSEDGGAASLKQWLDSCVRARYPLPCKWVANERAQDFGYWTFVTRRFDANSPVEISVAADKAKNQVLVTCTNVAQFTLYVNDDLVDMDKAVTLVVNGKEGKPVTLTRSADQLLAHSFAHNDGKLPRDPGCVFTNEIRDVAVAAPPKEEKKDAGAEEKKPADKAAEDGKKPEEGAGGGDGK